MSTKKQLGSRRGFLKTVGGLGAAAGGMRLGTGNSLAAGPAPSAPVQVSKNIHVGSRRQLLFDDFFVGGGDSFHESIPYGIRWTVGKVKKSPPGRIFNPIEPWHDKTAWFCVLYDEGRYRMWYNAAMGSLRGLFVCYVESDDGLNWHKPILNLIEKNGSKQNNIVYAGGPGAVSGLELGCVFRDPIAKPEERYKMIYPTFLTGKGEGGATLGATSSDGLNWTRTREIFVGKYCDTQNVATYDPVLGKYVAYIRWNHEALYGGLDVGEHPVAPSSRGRSVARIESVDYKSWTFPQLVLTPDFHDGLGVELYTPSYAHYSEADMAYFMFPSSYHVREGTFLTQVAVSRDNRTWMRPSRETLIPLGPKGAFDDYLISVSPGILPVDKDTRALYYSTANISHPGAEQKFWTKDPLLGGMGRVEFKRDRIVGIESGPDGGAFWTRPLLFEGKRLVVNVEPTGPDARLEVQLIGVGIGTAKPDWPENELAHWNLRDGAKDGPCPGYSFNENIPITSDELDAPVKWKERSSVGEWAGKPVRLHFRLRSMRIYAFQFVSEG